MQVMDAPAYIEIERYDFSTSYKIRLRNETEIS